MDHNKKTHHKVSTISTHKKFKKNLYHGIPWTMDNVRRFYSKDSEIIALFFGHWLRVMGCKNPDEVSQSSFWRTLLEEILTLSSLPIKQLAKQLETKEECLLAVLNQSKETHLSLQTGQDILEFHQQTCPDLQMLEMQIGTGSP